MRQLWIDKHGEPVIVTTANGERNALRWGWTAATAVPTADRTTEIRRAKAEGFYEAANCLHVLNCGCMAHIGFVNPYAEDRADG